MSATRSTCSRLYRQGLGGRRRQADRRGLRAPPPGPRARPPQRLPEGRARRCRHRGGGASPPRQHPRCPFLQLAERDVLQGALAKLQARASASLPPHSALFGRRPRRASRCAVATKGSASTLARMRTARPREQTTQKKKLRNRHNALQAKNTTRSANCRFGPARAQAFAPGSGAAFHRATAHREALRSGACRSRGRARRAWRWREAAAWRARARGSRGPPVKARRAGSVAVTCRGRDRCIGALALRSQAEQESGGRAPDPAGGARSPPAISRSTERPTQALSVRSQRLISFALIPRPACSASMTRHREPHAEAARVVARRGERERVRQHQHAVR